jgi:hypothetical protein
MTERRQPTQQEIDMRERAARQGYKLRRRGTEYHFTDEDGTGFGCGDIDGAIWWLDVIENKTPVQISTPCGLPMFKINDPDVPPGR